MKKVLIVYASVTGNTELVCQEVQLVLEEQGIDVKLQNCQLTKEADLLDCDLLIFGCPTYAHGELQAYFGEFLETISTIDLQGKLVTVIGLGDAKYDTDYTVESARILEDFFKTHGGDQVIESLEVRKSPLPQLKSTVKDWAEKLAKKLSS